MSIDQQAAEIYSGLARQINATTPGLIMADTGLGSRKCRFSWHWDEDKKIMSTMHNVVRQQSKYDGENLPEKFDLKENTIQVPEILGFQLYG